jgi:hypothetical protein
LILAEWGEKIFIKKSVEKKDLMTIVSLYENAVP